MLLGALGKLQGLSQVAPLEEDPLNLVLKQHLVVSVVSMLTANAASMRTMLECQQMRFQQHCVC